MVKILNTRPVGQNRDLSGLLRQAGFKPIEIPLVEISPSLEGLEKARGLSPSRFTGIFLSSPNGLKHLQGGLPDEIFGRWLEKPFFLVGSRTRPMIEALGGKVAFAPEEASVDGFLKEYQGFTAPGGLPLMQRWFHPCSSSTRLDPAPFRQRQVEVKNLPVYDPACPKNAAERLEMEGASAYAVLFCSGSAVGHFFQAAPGLAATLGAPKGLVAISIGPSTSKALAARGVATFTQAQRADNAGLLDALKAALSGADTQVIRKSPEGTP